jgi:hypothetical protein
MGRPGGIVVLKAIGTLARVAFGFALASVAAGLVTVLFVNTPAEVLTQPVSRLPETAGDTFDLALLAATHSAIFAFAFVLILASLAERFSIRGLPFYLIGGMAIALLGFIAQVASEIPGQPTVYNNYAFKTFITTGFFAGFVYWLAAGQFAGYAPEAAAEIDEPASPLKTVSKTRTEDRADETSVVIHKPATIEEPRPRYRTLLQRLSFARRDAPVSAFGDAQDDDQTTDDAVIVRKPGENSQAPRSTASAQPSDDT